MGGGGGTHICAQSLSSAAHQLSSGCHKTQTAWQSRLFTGQSKRSLPLLLNFSSTKGTIKMMSIGGRTVEGNGAHRRASCPRGGSGALPTVEAAARRRLSVGAAPRGWFPAGVSRAAGEQNTTGFMSPFSLFLKGLGHKSHLNSAVRLVQR